MEWMEDSHTEAIADAAENMDIDVSASDGDN
jgi:hypothetical protein